MPEVLDMSDTETEDEQPAPNPPRENPNAGNPQPPGGGRTTRLQQRKAEAAARDQRGEFVKIEGTENLHYVYNSLRNQPFEKTKLDVWWEQYMVQRDVPDHIEGTNLILGGGEALMNDHPAFCDLLKGLRQEENYKAIFVWLSAYRKHLISPEDNPFPLALAFQDQDLDYVVPIDDDENAGGSVDRKVVNVDDLPERSATAIKKKRKKPSTSGPPQQAEPPKKKKRALEVPVVFNAGMCMPALEVSGGDEDQKEPPEDEKMEDEPWMRDLRTKAEPDLKDGVRLKHCQLHNLKYMHDIESKVGTGREVYKKFRGLQGGILADDVGYGKTLTCLTMVNINPGSVPPGDLGKRDPRTKRFKSNCTLVVVPAHLPMQWESERNKWIAAHAMKKMHIVIDSATHSKITYKKICKADVVIVTDHFLKGSHYASISSPVYSWDHSEVKAHSEFIIRKAREGKLNGEWGPALKGEKEVYKTLKLDNKTPFAVFVNRHKIYPEVNETKQTRLVLVADKATEGKGSRATKKYRFLLLEVERWLTKSKMSISKKNANGEYVDVEIDDIEQHAALKKTVAHTTWSPMINHSLRRGFPGADVQLLEIKHSQIPAVTQGHWRQFVKPLDEQKLDNRCPLLHYIDWHRVIVDETHEFLANPHLKTGRKYFSMLNAINANFKWAVTATPCPTPQVFARIIQWLGSDVVERLYLENHASPNEPPRMEFKSTFKMSELKDIVLIRSSKEEAKDNELPDFQEEVHWVDLHPNEKLMHDVEVCLGNNDLAQQVVSNLFGVYEKLQINHDGGLTMRNFIRRLIKVYAKKIESRGRKFEKGKLQYSTMVKNPEEYSEMMIAQKRQKCRQLKKEQAEFQKRKEMIEAQIQECDLRAKEWEAKTDTVAKELVGKEGSKFAALISSVKQILKVKKTRIILFSQHAPVLKRVCSFLCKYGVAAKQMKGSAHQRSNVLGNFQDRFNKAGSRVKATRDYRVILLSTRYAASGADLHLATHVILLDAFNGLASEAYAYEKQAIGRAIRQGSKTEEVRIMRFISKDTIDEQLYARNIKAQARAQNIGKNKK